MTRIHIEVPDELHRAIKSRAAASGLTLKEFVMVACREKIATCQADIAALNSGCPECGGKTEIFGEVERCLKCGAEMELVEF